MGSQNSANTVLAALNRSSSVRQNWELAVAIYKAQVSFIFNKNDITANNLPWLAWYHVWDCLLWLHLLIFQAFDTLLYDVFDVCIHIHPGYQLPG